MTATARRNSPPRSRRSCSNSNSARSRPALQKGLVRLLQLLVKSMRDLTIDDPWLDRQINTVEKLIASPLDARLIENTERSLKDLVLKQGCSSTAWSKSEHPEKHGVAFVDRLGELSASTGDYYEKSLVTRANQPDRGHHRVDYLLNGDAETRLIRPAPNRRTMN